MFCEWQNSRTIKKSIIGFWEILANGSDLLFLDNYFPTHCHYKAVQSTWHYCFFHFEKQKLLESTVSKMNLPNLPNLAKMCTKYLKLILNDFDTNLIFRNEINSDIFKEF